MIKTQVIGHLGKDAVVNQVNGKNVINFNVAHSETFTDAQNQKVTKTIWVNCSYWAESTRIAPYLNKGTQVWVEGSPSVDTYTNNDRQVVAQFRLRVNQIQLLGSANRDQQPGQPRQQQPLNQNIPVHSSLHTTNGGPGIANASDITEPMDDLPF